MQKWAAKTPAKSSATSGRFRFRTGILSRPTPLRQAVQLSMLTNRMGDDVVFYVSGGTAAQTAVFTLVGYTAQGETINETIYLPILPTGNSVGFGDTAQEIIEFALKPIVGLAGSATTAELNDGLEWLNGLLASWRGQGADTGAVLPLSLSTVVYCPDEWLLAIKNNLRVIVAEQYGRQVSPTTAMLAARGVQQIKQANLAEDRGAAVYY